jgi:[protein-PII] uridylyltransferase
VFDAFYVQTETGQKLTDDAAKTTLHDHLMAVLTRKDLDGPRTPARRLARARPADSF